MYFSSLVLTIVMCSICSRHKLSQIYPMEIALGSFIETRENISPMYCQIFSFLVTIRINTVIYVGRSIVSYLYNDPYVLVIRDFTRLQIDIPFIFISIIFISLIGLELSPHGQQDDHGIVDRSLDFIKCSTHLQLNGVMLLVQCSVGSI